MWKAQNQHTNAVDIAPIIDGTGQLLLRAGISLSAGRLLHHSKGIAIGKSKVNQFGMMPIARNKNIFGLNISMDNLMRMNIAHSIA